MVEIITKEKEREDERKSDDVLLIIKMDYEAMCKSNDLTKIRKINFRISKLRSKGIRIILALKCFHIAMR